MPADKFCEGVHLFLLLFAVFHLLKWWWIPALTIHVPGLPNTEMCRVIFRLQLITPLLSKQNTINILSLLFAHQQVCLKCYLSYSLSGYIPDRKLSYFSTFYVLLCSEGNCTRYVRKTWREHEKVKIKPESFGCNDTYVITCLADLASRCMKIVRLMSSIEIEKFVFVFNTNNYYCSQLEF